MKSVTRVTGPASPHARLLAGCTMKLVNAT